jgi:uncharacterized protein YbaP (TraB family)
MPIRARTRAVSLRQEALVRRHRRLLLPAATVLGLACATPPPASAPTGQLFLWEVARPDGGGGVAHVLGSFHLSEQELHFDPAVDRALDAADTLVLEIAPEHLDPVGLASVSMEKGLFADDRTLDQVVSPETWRLLEERVAEYGLPIASFLPMEPWFALLTLQNVALQREGYAIEHGVESQLAEDAQEDGKPTQGLETPEEQLAAFDALPLGLQERQLHDFLTHRGGEADLSLLLELWRSGDDERLEQELFGELARDPSLAPYYQRLYFDRNARMARGIAERVDAGGRWFVAVGAGHVVGARGIPSLLAEDGYRVRRVPKTP